MIKKIIHSNLLILLSLVFWFKGNTLYFGETSILESFNNKCNYLRFQLDNKMPPNINKEDIKSIFVKDNYVVVHTNSSTWKVFHENDFTGKSWFVKKVQ